MTSTSTTYFTETGIDVVDGLLSGAYWVFNQNRTLTWSLADNPVTGYFWTEEDFVGTLDAAFQAWEAVANIQFEYIGHYSDFRKAPADIVLTIAGNEFFDSDKVVAVGIFPNEEFANDFLGEIGEYRSSYPEPEGDIAFNDDSGIYSFINRGSKSFATALHEIGHALGLKHPHDGGLAGYTTYAEAGIDQFDDGALTVMSYDPTSSSWVYGSPVTPMPLDILAIQTLYGMNETTNIGDTHYTALDDGVIDTVWDVSGNDTIDASRISHSVTLNLNQGVPSVLGYFTKAYIAFNTIIENAIGTSYGDDLYGNLADNEFYGGYGNDIIDGATGTDTANYNFSITQYSINKNISDDFLLSGPDGTDLLINIERLRFSDKNYALDIDGIGGQSYRVYKAAFDRDPDTEGLGFWIAQMDGGMDLIEVSARFIDSDEFRSLYGVNPTNGEYLSALYNNVLDRDPDQSGFDWWLDQMVNNPEKTWEKMLADFSESPENQENVIALIGLGFTYDEY